MGGEIDMYYMCTVSDQMEHWSCIAGTLET